MSVGGNKKKLITSQIVTGPTGTRTQVARIRTSSDNHLHYGTRVYGGGTTDRSNATYNIRATKVN